MSAAKKRRTRHAPKKLKPRNVKRTDYFPRPVTIFDSDPPTPEELAEWKKQWEREYPQQIVDNLTPKQAKDFRKLLKVSQNRQLEKQLASGRSQGTAKNIAKADERKNYLRKLCAERCARSPHKDLNDHVTDLWYECKDGNMKFQDPEGNYYYFTYKNKRVLKDIIRPAFDARKAALKNRQK